MKTLLKQRYGVGLTMNAEAERMQRLHAAIENRTTEVEVIVRPYRKEHSSEAQGYLWGICYNLMAQASGYEKEEIHTAMCCKQFGTVVVDVLGERITRPFRTTTVDENGRPDRLGDDVYGEMIELVIREASLYWDVQIPPPDPEKRKSWTRTR